MKELEQFLNYLQHKVQDIYKQETEVAIQRFLERRKDNTREHQLEETNREQRQTINELKATVKRLKQQYKEAIISLYYRIGDMSNVGHSDDIHKNIKMTDIADTTMKELYEGIKEDLYLENDEEGKIIELVNEYEAKH